VRPRLQFTLRQDQSGFRPVFPLGNAAGRCPYGCRFCSVKNSAKVTLEDSIRRFEELCEAYAPLLTGPYHPVIYNQGNVTNPQEFPRALLDHVLDRFNGNGWVQYVSLNSREREASDEVLQSLTDKDLSYPIHFIFGQESFSPRTFTIFGKDTRGELARFVHKLRPYNKAFAGRLSGKDYVFGLDVNLVFLPALYVEDDAPTANQAVASREGLKHDLGRLLAHVDLEVPFEVNIHPYHRVRALPYGDADLGLLMSIVPDLQQLLTAHNAGRQGCPCHLFLGVEGIGYDSAKQRAQIHKWKPVIDQFNRSGIVDFSLRSA